MKYLLDSVNNMCGYFTIVRQNIENASRNATNDDEKDILRRRLKEAYYFLSIYQNLYWFITGFACNAHLNELIETHANYIDLNEENMELLSDINMLNAHIMLTNDNKLIITMLKCFNQYLPLENWGATLHHINEMFDIYFSQLQVDNALKISELRYEVEVQMNIAHIAEHLKAFPTKRAPVLSYQLHPPKIQASESQQDHTTDITFKPK